MAHRVSSAATPTDSAWGARYLVSGPIWQKWRAAGDEIGLGAHCRTAAGTSEARSASIVSDNDLP